jgi:hypothetical protein
MSVVRSHEPWGLVPAVVFCSLLLLLVGAIIEHGARIAIGRR